MQIGASSTPVNRIWSALMKKIQVHNTLSRSSSWLQSDGCGAKGGIFVGRKVIGVLERLTKTGNASVLLAPSMRLCWGKTRVGPLVLPKFVWENIDTRFKPTGRGMRILLRFSSKRLERF
jgi:hypothetical protein